MSGSLNTNSRLSVNSSITTVARASANPSLWMVHRARGRYRPCNQRMAIQPPAYTTAKAAGWFRKGSQWWYQSEPNRAIETTARRRAARPPSTSISSVRNPIAWRRIIEGRAYGWVVRRRNGTGGLFEGELHERRHEQIPGR